MIWLALTARAADPCADVEDLRRWYDRVPPVPEHRDYRFSTCMDGDGRSETLAARARRCLGADPWDIDATRVLSVLGTDDDVLLLAPSVLTGSYFGEVPGAAMIEVLTLRACETGGGAMLLDALEAPVPWLPSRPRPAPTRSEYDPHAALRPGDPEAREAARRVGFIRAPEYRAVWRAVITGPDDELAVLALENTQRVERDDRAILEELASGSDARAAAAARLLQVHPETPRAPVGVTSTRSRTPTSDADFLRRWGRTALGEQQRDAMVVWAHVATVEDLPRIAEIARSGTYGLPHEARVALVRFGTADAVQVVAELARATDDSVARQAAAALSFSRDPAVRAIAPHPSSKPPATPAAQASRAPWRIPELLEQARADPEVAANLVPFLVRTPAWRDAALDYVDSAPEAEAEALIEQIRRIPWDETPPRIAALLAR